MSKKVQKKKKKLNHWEKTAGNNSQRLKLWKNVKNQCHNSLKAMSWWAKMTLKLTNLKSSGKCCYNGSKKML